MTANMQAEEWQVESKRVSLFLSAKPPLIGPGLWNLLTHEAAESSTTQPRQGLFIEEGSFEGHRMVAQGTPGRIDLFLVPPVSNDLAFASIGRLSEDYEGFDKVVSKLLELANPSIKRVAIGQVLRLSTPTRQDGYRTLARYLPSVQMHPETSSDFLFQINRKRTINVGGDSYEINRLSKWSVAIILRSYFNPPNDAIVSGLFTNTTESVQACTLELDMSTAGERELPLPSVSVSLLVNELVAQANLIAKEGDIP